MRKDREITLKAGGFNNYYGSLPGCVLSVILLSLAHSLHVKTRITYHLTLYHHFGKGLFECWIC